jgi:hypothetical protein
VAQQQQQKQQQQQTQQQTQNQPQGSCPVAAQSDNPYVKDIMTDCNRPQVLDTISKYWGKGGSRNSELLSFLNAASGCKQHSTRTCYGAEFRKMAAVFAQSDLPLVAAFVSVEESGFTPKVTSDRSAHGWWQFMPATAKELSPPLSNTDLEDITKSTKGFIQYFGKALKAWHGDFKMALLYYNGGPGWANYVGDSMDTLWKNNPNVPDQLKEGYAIYKNYWDIQTYCMIPRKISSQVTYVPEVLGAIFAGTAPQAYEINDYTGLEMR